MFIGGQAQAAASESDDAMYQLHDAQPQHRHRFTAAASRPDDGQQEGVVRRLRDGRAPHGRGKVDGRARGERLR
jgi:hypothetical protein